MTKPYKETVVSLLQECSPQSILDIACGDGWLKEQLTTVVEIDGVDLYAHHPEGYRKFFKIDINEGLPEYLPKYEAIVCCEAIAYLDNPGIFLRSIFAHLKPGGMLVISSPNPTYVGARLHFFVRGFFPGFSFFMKNKERKPHMPWLALGWTQFWLLLGLSGFSKIQLHDVNEKKPKHYWEKFISWPLKIFCLQHKKKSITDEENYFWEVAGSAQAIYGRRLVVSAIVPL